MRYRLPQAAKTSKLLNLPADLLALAEEALAEKFDLPEIVTEKPKPKRKKASAPSSQSSTADQRGHSDGGGAHQALREIPEWQRGQHLVTISVQSGERRVRHRPVSMEMGSPMDQINMMSSVEEELVWYHQSVSIDKRMSFNEVEYILDKSLRQLLDRVYRQAGSNWRQMTMSCDGYSYPIKTRHDIARFIERELR